MLNSRDFQAVVRQHGRFFYHVTDTANVSSILRKGLVPWNINGVGAVDEGACLPRPGHVYLQSLSRILEFGERVSSETVFQVDLMELLAANINPDEDAYWCSGFGLNEERLPTPAGMSDPLRVVKDSLRAVKHGWKEEFGSYGQWAEEHKLGKNSQDTMAGIANTRTLAYQGSIAASKLRCVNVVGLCDCELALAA